MNKFFERYNIGLGLMLFLILVIICYLLTSFLCWDMNPANWGINQDWHMTKDGNIEDYVDYSTSRWIIVLLFFVSFSVVIHERKRDDD